MSMERDAVGNVWPEGYCCRWAARPAEFYAGGAQGYKDYPSLSFSQSPDLNSSHARVNARVSSAV
jgi:hypothetical protein